MLAVIMAGGRGTRFWPASRTRKPKQFLDITGSGPMVVETCRRLGTLVGDDGIVVIVAREHLEEAQALFNDSRIRILAEPEGRNTAPCIGLGSVYARYLGYQGPMAFLPADHFVRDGETFIKALRKAGELAGSGGIVTLGIQPESPATGFGYIKRDDEPLKGGGIDVYRALEFVEKPDGARALEYLTDGRYYWNSGIFVARPDTILKEMETLLPDHWRGLRVLEDAFGTEGFEGELNAVYRDFKTVSFDYGIMEKTHETVYVIPCTCGWSDVGSWSSLYELSAGDHDLNGNKKIGEAVLVDCEGNFIWSGGGRVVTCLGLKGCLVVDTGDALLVADMEKAQDVRRVVERLKAGGREEVL